jgi:hypothetical protein
MRDINFNDCIYKSSDKVNNQNTTDTDHIDQFYTILGQQEFIDDDKLPRTNSENKALAKLSVVNGETKYFAKVNTYGKLFNPMGMFSEGKSQKFLSRIGRNEYNFKRVTLRTFELYTSFLKSRNIAWINQAEREMN